MILFLTLFLLLLILMVVVVFALVAGGAAFITVFGDVIIFVFILVMLVKHFTRKK